MALDGTVISNIVYELNNLLIGGRLYKIAQPETDELMLTIKNNSSQYRLTISANASLPLIYIAKDNKPSPLTAPNFCMLLRKHINNGRIISITQPGLERVIDFKIEHLNEMGDLCQKHLVVELMGKHSNIIFTTDDNMILDSIKHVSSQMSSVREVLPGRPYFIPETTDKANPLTADFDTFSSHVYTKPMPILKALYGGLTGISPVISEEIIHQASIDSAQPANTLNDIEKLHLYKTFTRFIDNLKNNEYQPVIYCCDGIPKEFASFSLSIYDGGDCTHTNYDTISDVLTDYYSGRNAISRIRQRSADLRKIVATALERNYKKLSIQEKQLKDTDKRDKFRIYGELINTYGYNIEEGAKELVAYNYYSESDVTIPLDNTLSPKDNAVKYFDKYNKLKRTYEATTKLVEETTDDINHLESIQTALDIAVNEDDLLELKEELIDYGYIKRKSGSKKSKSKSKPFHYVSSDGFDIYVGKNNYQNDELTFKFATGNDWWFHAKSVAGSHVIVKSNGEELPDRVYEEAASLAAYYSKGREQDKVEVDYIQKKHVKKPAAAKPGFVVYYTNYSMMASTNISSLKQL